MKSVPRSIEITDPVGHLLDLVFQVLLLDDLLIELLLKALLVFLKCLLLLLLLVVQLDNIVVHRLNLLSLGEDHFFVVLLNGVIIHFGVAFVAHSVEFFITN